MQLSNLIHKRTSWLDVLIGRAKLERKLEAFRLARHKADPAGFWRDFLEAQDIAVECRGLEHLRSAIESDRPVMLVVNHPRGLLDGFCIGNIFDTYFPNQKYRLLANKIVGQVLWEMGPNLIDVNNMSRDKAQRSKENAQAILLATQALQNREVVALFPAGEVSEFKLSSPEGWAKVTDCDWRKGGLEIANRVGALILPVHIGGRNRISFYVFALFGTLCKRIYQFHEFAAVTKEKTVVTIREPLVAGAGTAAIVRRKLYDGSFSDKESK